MSNPDIIRAWKDAKYRESLSAEELAALPAHPAGDVELSDAELAGVDGGTQITPTTTALRTAVQICRFTSDLVLCVNTVHGETCPISTAGAAICPIIG